MWCNACLSRYFVWPAKLSSDTQLYWGCKPIAFNIKILIYLAYGPLKNLPLGIQTFAPYVPRFPTGLIKTCSSTGKCEVEPPKWLYCGAYTSTNFVFVYKATLMSILWRLLYWADVDIPSSIRTTTVSSNSTAVTILLYLSSISQKISGLAIDFESKNY